MFQLFSHTKLFLFVIFERVAFNGRINVEGKTRGSIYLEVLNMELSITWSTMNSSWVDWDPRECYTLSYIILQNRIWSHTQSSHFWILVIWWSFERRFHAPASSSAFYIWLCRLYGCNYAQGDGLSAVNITTSIINKEGVSCIRRRLVSWNAPVQPANSDLISVLSHGYQSQRSSISMIGFAHIEYTSRAKIKSIRYRIISDRSTFKLKRMCSSRYNLVCPTHIVSIFPYKIASIKYWPEMRLTRGSMIVQSSTQTPDKSSPTRKFDLEEGVWGLCSFYWIW